MTTIYLTVVFTGLPKYVAVHNATRPWAVVNLEATTGAICSVVGRYASLRGAQAAYNTAVKAASRKPRPYRGF